MISTGETQDARSCARLTIEQKAGHTAARKRKGAPLKDESARTRSSVFHKEFAENDAGKSVRKGDAAAAGGRGQAGKAPAKASENLTPKTGVRAHFSSNCSGNVL